MSDNDNSPHAVAMDLMRAANEKLGDENAVLREACRSAGLCMSCLFGSPDPLGCTDCLGTGWAGGNPHDQIKRLKAALNLAVSRGCDHCSESIRQARAMVSL